MTLLFQAEKPLQEPVRYSLVGKTKVFIGRGKAASSSEGKELRLQLDDEFVSSEHATIEKERGLWFLRDRDARNGTWVDGAEVGEYELRDGSVIEVGSSFFIFREADSLEESPSPDSELQTLNPAYSARLKSLVRIAFGTVPVVLRGESGTGKEVTAQAIHRLSGRSGLFQALNCAALPAELVEAELFGHEKGAFTGATTPRQGVIRSAQGGTLFLDEIGDLPLSQQPKLLRVLEEQTVKPVGSDKALPVDFRLVVATNRDLEAMVAAETFRGDLLARLSGFTHVIPPLRERREDLGTLIARLLQRYAGNEASRIRFTLEAARALVYYSWRLNVRELAMALRSSIELAEEGEVDVQHLPGSLTAPRPGAPDEGTVVLSRDPVRRKEQLIELLVKHEGNVTAVARVTGKARMQIHRWMREYRINPNDYRPKSEL
ncbi:MAG TPA: sigma 54-interacting transcriptional regulator [Myxococcales bacterium]|nr:sigma 54-interacting transcriptional regulator [Myxococcales bacterium]